MFYLHQRVSIIAIPMKRKRRNKRKKTFHFIMIIRIVSRVTSRGRGVLTGGNCLQKMADSLVKYGLFIDDLTKIRVLEPEIANQTNKLKEECQTFVSSKF